jgi:hypothetical protein
MPETAVDRWEVAESNYRTFLEEVMKVSDQVDKLPAFEGKAEARVCLYSLSHELYGSTREIDRAAKNDGPLYGIRRMCHVLRRIRLVLQPAIVSARTRLHLGGRDFVAQAMGFVPEQGLNSPWTPFLTSARLCEKFRDAGLPGSWDTIKQRVDDGEFKFHPKSTRGSWSLFIPDLPELMRNSEFWAK